MGDKILIPGGFYITFDGPEGSGKSSQIAMLYDRFIGEGYDVLKTKEPGGTKVATGIRQILIDRELSGEEIIPLAELFLFEAARAQLKSQVINPAISEGKFVVSDRSSFSSEAYQGYAGQLPLDLVKQLNSIANMGVVPDLSFFIDVDVADGLEREVDKNRFNAKGLAYHERVRHGFLEIAKDDPERRKVIQFRYGDKEGMHDEIYRYAKEAIDRKLAG